MPKLTLRDLFAVVTIVALVLGWWLDHQRMAQRVDGLSWRLDSVQDELERSTGMRMTFWEDLKREAVERRDQTSQPK